jgi:hypothetical protein
MAGIAPTISGAVEGIVDEAVLRRLIQSVRAEAGPVYGRNGKGRLLERLPGYNNAARFAPWLVLVDLDQDADCAPPFRTATLPLPAPKMCFRVAVREIEAWIMADRERLAQFLDVNPAWISSDPDGEPDPKARLVGLARRSKSRDISRDFVPRPGSRRIEGPAYSSRLIQFVSDRRAGWRPSVAARSSESLARCLRCLRRLARQAARELAGT